MSISACLESVWCATWSRRLSYSLLCVSLPGLYFLKEQNNSQCVMYFTYCICVCSLHFSFFNVTSLSDYFSLLQWRSPKTAFDADTMLYLESFTLLFHLCTEGPQLHNDKLQKASWWWLCCPVRSQGILSNVSNHNNSRGTVGKKKNLTEGTFYSVSVLSVAQPFESFCQNVITRKGKIKCI